MAVRSKENLFVSSRYGVTKSLIVLKFILA